ncbi:unnamed protein product, partial [Prorocentrum cordatum]
DLLPEAGPVLHWAASPGQDLPQVLVGRLAWPSRPPTLHWAVCLSQGTERGCSDARLDCGLPHGPGGWPFSSPGPLALRWRAAFGAARPKQRAAHANVRELQAARAAPRRRAHKASCPSSRWPHLVDSQVVAAIAAKGRSNSRRFQPTLQRCVAAAVAADMHQVVGNAASGDNPADESSRWLRRGSRLRHRYLAAVSSLLEHHGAVEAGVKALGKESEDADALIAGYSASRLHLSWAPLKTRRKREPAARALPFTPETAGAMAEFTVEAGCIDTAHFFAVAFAGLLRGGEAFILQGDGAALRGPYAVLRIAWFETTAGRDAAEAFVIRSAIKMLLLREALVGLPEGERLSSRSPHQLRMALLALVEGLGFQELFSWHWRWRGGALEHLLRTKTMVGTLALTAGVVPDGQNLRRGRRVRHCPRPAW